MADVDDKERRKQQQQKQQQRRRITERQRELQDELSRDYMIGRRDAMTGRVNPIFHDDE